MQNERCLVTTLKILKIPVIVFPVSLKEKLLFPLDGIFPEKIKINTVDIFFEINRRY